MSEKKPLPLAKWRLAEAVMRRIEENKTGG